MKQKLFIFSALALILTGCFPAKIVTVTPYNEYQRSYATTVTTPTSSIVTTNTRVTPLTNDLSLYLDLQAVGAAFAQSKTVSEFESLLNDSSYIISNLDLNGDGYVDYLRVLETVDGYNHVFLVQAVLAPDVYQDVCTIVAEAPATKSVYVQIIGAPYIYGPDYFLHPIFVTRPPIFDYFYRYDYRVWHSPWYWNHFPPYYRHPIPLHLGHYQAYVRTYMLNHHYCHQFDYPRVPHYADYNRVSSSMQRNDYGKQHPERAFVERNAENPAIKSGNSGEVFNARSIRERQAATTSTTTSSSPRRSSTSASGNQTSAIRSTSGTSTSSRAATGSGASRSSATTSTTTQSRVRSSGSTDTKITTRSSGTTSTINRSSGTSSRSSGSSSSSRSYSSGSSSSRSYSGSSSSSSRSSSSGSSSRGFSSSSSSSRGSSSSSSSRSSSSGSSSRSSSGSTGSRR